MFKYSYVFILLLNIIVPSHVVSGFLPHISYFVLLFASLCLFIFNNVNSVLKKNDFIFIYPLLFMIIIIVLSHIKGAVIGINLSGNDFSEYIKFSSPFLLFVAVLSFIRKYDIFLLVNTVWLVCLIYASLFFVYIIDAGAFIYNIGLGRGAVEFYRYAGIDQNPNVYAAIVIALFCLSFPDAVEKPNLFKWIILLFLVTSLVFSQSRTNIFLFAGLIIYLFMFLRISIWYKFFCTLVLSITLFLFFSNFELYWLTAPDRLNVANDNSFNTRFHLAINEYLKWSDYVGLIGIGPARATLDRLDAFTYLMYFISYGYIGVLAFVYIHLRYSFFFLKAKISCGNRSLYINMAFVFPLYVLITNISNEKWIDMKFLLLWMLLLAIAKNEADELKLSLVSKYKEGCS